jgi:DNA-binding beta-propeller fold protein YncE
MKSRIVFLAALLTCACALPLAAQTLVTDITIPGNPNGMAVNPTTNRIYVATGNTSNGPAVIVIDGSTNTVIDTIDTPQGASFVAVNKATNRVYDAGCVFGQTETCDVTVIDGATDKVIATLPVAGSSGIGVQAIAVDPVWNRIYVADDNNYEIEEINGYTNRTTYINTGNTETLGLAVDFRTHQIIGAPSGGAIDIYNGTTHGRRLISVGLINQDVAVNSFTHRAYITNDAGSTLGVVDLQSSRVVNVTVGNAPYGVCVDYLSNLIFVANAGDQTVSEVNGTTNTVTGTVNANSNYLDVNPSTKLVYASDPFGTTVHVISE